MNKHSSDLALVKSLPVGQWFFFGDITVKVSRHTFSKRMSEARVCNLVKRQRKGRYAAFFINAENKESWISKIRNERLVPGFKQQLFNKFMEA